MLGYVALFVVGLLFFAGLAYLFRTLFRLNRKVDASEGDPLLGQLEVKEAEKKIKSGKAIGVLIYSILFCGLIWYLFYYEPAPAYSVTSIELYDEFNRNKEEASTKYQDEYIVVSGQYLGDEIVFGSPAILLATAVESGWVQCNFEGSRATQVSSLSKGQTLSLKGRVLGKRHNVILEKCSVLNQN